MSLRIFWYLSRRLHLCSVVSSGAFVYLIFLTGISRSTDVRLLGIVRWMVTSLVLTSHWYRSYVIYLLFSFASSFAPGGFHYLLTYIPVEILLWHMIIFIPGDELTFEISYAVSGFVAHSACNNHSKCVMPSFRALRYTCYRTEHSIALYWNTVVKFSISL